MLAALLSVALLASLPALPAGRCVLDQPGALAAAEASRLEAACEELDRSGAGQLAVAVVDDFGDRSADDFATDLFTQWRLGHKGRDDGVLVVLEVGPPGRRDLRVRVGYGLEGALPDGKVGALIDQHAMVALRQARWGEGLVPLVDALIAETKKENAAGAVQRRLAERSARESAGTQAAGAGVFMFLLLCAWAVGMAAFAVRRRLPGRATRYVGMGFTLAGLAGVLLNPTFAGPMVLGWGVFTFLGVVLFWALARHRCPRCGAWMRLTQTVLRAPTYREPGYAELEKTCTSCSYSAVEKRVLPRKTRTVVVMGGWGGGRGGFGGGGFGGGGGGSTGGGGAGRSF